MSQLWSASDDRLRHIRWVTDSALAHLDIDSFIDELLDRVREIVRADTAAVLLLQESSQELVATVARGIEEEVRQDTRVPLGQGFAGRVAAEGKPVFVDQLDNTTVLDQVLRAKGIRSLLGVPLLADGRVMGVLHVGSLTGRRFTVDEADLLQLAADRVALALRARRSRAERTASVALQRSLVPERLPDIAGLEMAGRYVTAEGGGVGGDWYDLFTAPTGHVCITIGDVVGRGLRAAVVMGRLRSTVRAYALEVLDPAEVLARVDRKLQHFEPAEMATVLFAVFDPSLQHLRISLAGHPAPILARPGGPVDLLDLPVDPPIGVRRGLRRRATTFEVPAGAVLCFYTDGLVERRTIPLDARLEALRRTVTADAPDDVCRAVMSRMVVDGAPADDIAVLVVRRLDPAQMLPLDMLVPAVPSSQRQLRAAVRRWLSATPAEPTDVNDLSVAVGEACSNAIEHAYGPGRGTIALRLELEAPDTVVATVRDTGQWRQPRGHNRGRGIRLMEGCSDELSITPGPEGTTVVIRRRLGSRGP